VAVIAVFIGLAIISTIGSFVTAGILGCLLFPLMMLAWLGALVYLIIGAVQVNGGKDFEYKVIGPWVRQSL
jgi:uncharacterized Tic20 family protein